MAMYFPDSVVDREAACDEQAHVQQDTTREPNIEQHERMDEIEEIINDQEAVVYQNVSPEPVSNEESLVAEILGDSDTEQAAVHGDAASEPQSLQPILGIAVVRPPRDDHIQLPIQNTIARHVVIDYIAPQQLQIADQQNDEVGGNWTNIFVRRKRVRKIPDRLNYKRFQCAHCFRFFERTDIPGEIKILFCSTRCFHNY